MDIRKILNIITENEKLPVFEGMKVMSLDQFLKSQGVEPKKDEEVDEAKLDVSAKPFNKDELIAYLDRVMGVPDIDKKTGKPKTDKKGKEKYISLKTKTDKYKFPYIHRSNIPIVNQDGKKYDLDALAKLFSERPTKILKQNEKMQHSDGTASQFYNVGLPALIGLAVDEDKNEFVVINTCPGAGNCKLVCYAMKGGYVQYPASNIGQTRLLNFLYNDPDGFMSMLANEIAEFDAKNKKKNIKTIIRWHDAGDFFSPEYLSKAYDLAKKFPNVDFYAYTKLASVAKGDKPDNFKINFSMGAQPSQEKQIDFEKTKNSRIVPEEIFGDALVKDENDKWQYKNAQAEQTVKDRIAQKYKLDPKSIITYDEMMKIPVGKEKGKWNVIVKPGDGDDAANRNDVLSSLLLIH
jgi:Gene product 88